MGVTHQGRTYVVPNVYGNITVNAQSSNVVPKFSGLLLVGEARQGIPYSTGLKGNEIIQAFVGASELKAVYGTKSGFTTAFDQAKIGGAGVINTIIVNPLTRITVPLKDTSGTPKTICNIKPVIYGATGNDIKLKITNSAGTIGIDITPVKYNKFLTADLDGTGSKVISLDDIEGISVGDSVYLEDNGSTTNYATATVAEVLTNYNQVVLDTTIASLTKANYARLFKLDTENKKTLSISTTASGLLQKVLDFFNTSGIVVAERLEAHDGNPATIAAMDDFIGTLETTAGNLGKSPVATDSDYSTIADALPRLLEEFTNYTKARIRIIVPLTAVQATHTKFIALAKSLRTSQYAVMIISGCAKGDIAKAESDSSHPIARAKAANTDDFVLAGMGLNGGQPYETLAAQVAGIISGSEIRHNPVRDSISADSVEKFFGEYNQETEAKKFVESGVLIVSSTKTGYLLTHAVNTYQNQTAVWNSGDKKSYLIQQRQMADYVFESFREGYINDAGNENTTEAGTTVKGNTILSNLVNEGVIKSEGKGVSVARQNDALIVTPKCALVDSNNIIVFDLTLQV